MITPAHMPTRVGAKPPAKRPSTQPTRRSPRRTPRPLEDRSTVCHRGGCVREIETPERYRFCSVLCVGLDQMLSGTENLCSHADHPESAELWLAAVAAVDAVTSVVETRDRVWRERVS